MQNKVLNKGYATLFFSKIATKKNHKYDPHKEGNPQSIETPMSDVSIGVRDFKEPKR